MPNPPIGTLLHRTGGDRDIFAGDLLFGFVASVSARAIIVVVGYEIHVDMAPELESLKGNDLVAVRVLAAHPAGSCEFVGEIQQRIPPNYPKPDFRMDIRMIQCNDSQLATPWQSLHIPWRSFTNAIANRVDAFTGPLTILSLGNETPSHAEVAVEDSDLNILGEKLGNRLPFTDDWLTRIKALELGQQIVLFRR